MNPPQTPAAAPPPAEPDPRRSPPTWLPRALAQTAVAAFAAIIVWRAAATLGTVITIVVVSWFVSLAMEPAIRWLTAHHIRRTRATGLVMAITLLGVLATFALFGGLFITQLVALVQALPRFYADLALRLDQQLGLTLPEADDLVDAIGANWQGLAPGIVGVGTSIVSVLFQFSAVLLVVYYMASSGARLRQAVCRPLSPRRQREVLQIWEISQEKVADFMVSRLILAAASTVVTFIVLTVLRVPYALPLAAFTGVVSQFVPTVGTYIGGALPVVVALTISPVRGLLVLAFIVAYQQVENLLLSPKVSQQSLALNPAIAFLAVLAFGAVFGALGAFLALPVAAVIQAVSSTYVRRHELVESPMLTDDAGQSPTPATPSQVQP
ncbi:MAG: AI-2E family transporter [Actinobacteria bacterium]|nr:AI-2E family transporter [Actinomycetota bacterium]